MELVEFSIAKNGRTGTFFQSAPLEFIERIKNTGTVHEQPVSQVLVKDMFGNSVVNLNMNLEGRNVLPESTRKFTVNMDESAIGKRILFGRYTAELTAKYGTNDQVITEKIAFWVIPWGLILGLLIGLAAVVIFIIVTLRRYKASVVRKTRTTRRR